MGCHGTYSISYTDKSPMINWYDMNILIYWWQYIIYWYGIYHDIYIYIYHGIYNHILLIMGYPGNSWDLMIYKWDNICRWDIYIYIHIIWVIRMGYILGHIDMECKMCLKMRFPRIDHEVVEDLNMSEYWVHSPPKHEESTIQRMEPSDNEYLIHQLKLHIWVIKN